MYKRVLAIFLALAILLIPATSFAASTVKQGNIDYYAGKIDSNYDYYDRSLSKYASVNAGMTQVSTENTKQLAKLTSIQTKMNKYLADAVKGFEEANQMLSDLKVGDPKAEAKLLKVKIKTISKNLSKANKERKDLRHRLRNLRINVE